MSANSSYSGNGSRRQVKMTMGSSSAWTFSGADLGQANDTDLLDMGMKRGSQTNDIPRPEGGGHGNKDDGGTGVGSQQHRRNSKSKDLLTWIGTAKLEEAGRRGAKGVWGLWRHWTTPCSFFFF